MTLMAFAKAWNTTATADEIMMATRWALVGVQRWDTGIKRAKNLWFGSQDWGALALVTVGINCLAFSGHDNLHESRTTGKQKTLDDEANINMATLCSGVVPSRRRVSAWASKITLRDAGSSSNRLAVRSAGLIFSQAKAPRQVEPERRH